MFPYIVVLVVFTIFFMREYLTFKTMRIKQERKLLELKEKEVSFESIDRAVAQRFAELEAKIKGAFLVYELGREISPLLNREKLFNVFKERLSLFGEIEDVVILEEPKEGYSVFELKDESWRFLGIKTASRKVKEYLPIVLRQINLCLEKISLYERLQKLSIHDTLTLTFNRRHFMERFFEEFARAKRFNLNLSFLMVDIDYFKRINDTYGHLVGDVVLKEVAKILKENVREVDFVARWGGEEFSLLLHEAEKTQAIMIAERIVREVGTSKIKAFDEELSVTVSIGVASYPENTVYSDILIEVADRALYKAKEKGRNRVAWF